MLDQVTATKLKELGFDVEKLEEAIKSESEVAYTLPTVYSETQLADEKKKIMEKANTVQQKIGKELLIKDLKEELGYEFEGKDAKTFLEHHNAKVLESANIKPEEAKKAWEKEREKLVGELKTEREAKEKLIADNANQARQNKLMQSLPKDRNDMLSDNDYLAIINARMEVKTEDGAEVVYWDGNKIEDKDYNAMKLTDAINHIFTSNPNWIKKTGEAEAGEKKTGSGFGDSFNKAGMFNTLAELEEHAAKKGIDVGSEKFQTLLNDAISKNPKLVEVAA